MSAIWHDLECGFYSEDLALWRELAQLHGDPVLDIGAGTGRVTLELARCGHEVVALDREAELLEVLEQRARGLQVSAVCADARDFDLRRRFSLCIVPMQTVQLLGGSEARMQFLRCARRHLNDRGMLALALTTELESYETDGGLVQVTPDMTEVDGMLYSSQPVAIRAREQSFVLVRRREQVDPSGRRAEAEDHVELDRLTPEQLEQEGSAVGLSCAGREQISETDEYAGSVVVMLGA